MTYGSLNAGDSYTLECSVVGSDVTIQWLGPPDGRTSIVRSDSINISSTSTTSQLQFRPIQQSNNGSYSCNVTVDGLALSSEPIVISVNGTYCKRREIGGKVELKLPASPSTLERGAAEHMPCILLHYCDIILL